MRNVLVPMKYVSSTNCCAGSMTGHGIPQGFCVIHPFRVFPQAEARNAERRKLGHAPKVYHLHAARYGQIVPVEKRDEIMLETGHITEYRTSREQALYVADSMRRSWRRKGISRETWLSYVAAMQKEHWRREFKDTRFHSPEYCRRTRGDWARQEWEKRNQRLTPNRSMQRA